ncbi:uncharacterized protein L3040_007829 [Drepanopeziza brunnea f. sp. 'multigermtubi']|uniref:uncharacterized protein n=1 Tax=Drepanopeziza brunnea f. sp. 'multigermtubi' TaxID=698441 RepID=UPI002387C941|nr:hypothetical protein L3040_007829 [Drepanopeziza brunnea f. sp. 'multigermtubi']
MQPTFPLPSRPLCYLCGKPCRDDITKSSNANGHCGRPYYYCNDGHDRKFITFDDSIGIATGNPACACGHASRRGLTNGPQGREFFSCPVGACRGPPASPASSTAMVKTVPAAAICSYGGPMSGGQGPARRSTSAWAREDPVPAVRDRRLSTRSSSSPSSADGIIISSSSSSLSAAADGGRSGSSSPSSALQVSNYVNAIECSPASSESVARSTTMVADDSAPPYTGIVATSTDNVGRELLRAPSNPPVEMKYAPSAPSSESDVGASRCACFLSCFGRQG